jgi:hypothetical protein
MANHWIARWGDYDGPDVAVRANAGRAGGFGSVGRVEGVVLYPSFSCSTGCTPFGSAFPLLFFITCPTKNPMSLVSPPR